MPYGYIMGASGTPIAPGSRKTSLFAHPPTVDPAADELSGPMKVECPRCNVPMGEPCQDSTGKRLDSPENLRTTEYFGQTVQVHWERVMRLDALQKKYVGRYRVLRVPEGHRIVKAGEIIFGLIMATRIEYVHLIRAESDNAHLDGVIRTEDVELVNFTEENRMTANPGTPGLRK